MRHLSRTAVQRLFATELERFTRACPWMPRKATLRVVQRPCTLPGHCATRDLAYASDATVTLLARALALPRANVVGLVRHELGHIADPWPTERDAEQRADDIAEFVTGVRVRYDRQLVQTVGTGTYPRPRRLHR